MTPTPSAYRFALGLSPPASAAGLCADFSCAASHSRIATPPSFSALVPRSNARCCRRRCASAGAFTKNRFKVRPPSSLLIPWQSNGGRQSYASNLTYNVTVGNIGRQGSPALGRVAGAGIETKGVAVSIQYGPIVRWPGRLRAPHERIRAPFKSSHTDTLRLLEREVRMIHGETPVVQIALEPHQFTRDGLPYSKATAKHPGVIVSFSKPLRLADGKRVKVPLSFPCDRFHTWETNLRAVALALEDLRRVDRYGVTQNAEQYTGFKALPGPVASMPTFNADEAARWVVNFVPAVYALTPSRVLSDPESWAKAYQMAARALHPDMNGGTVKPEWQQLQQAKELLDTIHARH